MEKFYNGSDAAKRIGISYKTLLRWIEKGKIIPEEAKTPTGQLVISGDQVEAAKREVAQERALLRQSKTSTPIGNPPEHDIDSLITKVQDLERRVSELEKRQPQTIVDSPSMSIPISSSHPSTPKPQPQKSIVEPSGEDMLLVDFAKMSGIPARTLHNWIDAGKIEVSSRPKHSGGGVEYLISPEEQEKALQRRHGKS